MKSEGNHTENANRVVVAFGSNLGDRFFNIELGIRLLEIPMQLLTTEIGPDASGFVTVIDTSFLYETSPMYVVDQPPFVNGACIIETNLPPVILLRLLKHIESVVGRVRTIRNGPRAIDLDMLFYADTLIDTRPPNERSTLTNLEGNLVVPHPLMCEREFVLRPLNDMIPDYLHPVRREPIHKLLQDLPNKDPSICRVLPFPLNPPLSRADWPFPAILPVPATLTIWRYPVPGEPPRFDSKHSSYIMATLNVTPDSFSDGATHNSLPDALQYVREAAESGVSIIDIGGYSTRPGAAYVSSEEEVNRVIPIVQAIRKPDTGETQAYISLRDLPISVDTFRWEVALAAIKAGANCINDVYAFTGNGPYPLTGDAVGRAQERMDCMKKVAREHAVPVILMHSRGDAGQHKDYSIYEDGSSDPVIRGVQRELGAKVERIIKGPGGIRRWLIIVDPGIGFSKTLEANLTLLRDASRIVADTPARHGPRNDLRGYPFLIGPSRKSFLGVILSQGKRRRETVPRERIWATAAAVACAVQQRSLVIRVHDTKEMADVVAIADQLWR